uniref:Uncharacterized protein n=1 Tax=Glossina morsitans morsitans TaxID=37546 RepID=A0A1B0GAN8_GLOMM
MRCSASMRLRSCILRISSSCGKGGNDNIFSFINCMQDNLIDFFKLSSLEPCSQGKLNIRLLCTSMASAICPILPRNALASLKVRIDSPSYKLPIIFKYISISGVTFLRSCCISK